MVDKKIEEILSKQAAERTMREKIMLAAAPLYEFSITKKPDGEKNVFLRSSSLGNALALIALWEVLFMFGFGIGVLYLAPLVLGSIVVGGLWLWGDSQLHKKEAQNATD